MYTNLRFLNRDLSDSPQPRKLFYSPSQERKTRSMSPTKVSKGNVNPFLPSIHPQVPIALKPTVSNSFISRPKNHSPSPNLPSKVSFSDPVSAEENPGYGCIYGFGLGAGFYKPIGAGFLIVRNVVLTSRTVIHNQDTALRCQIQFQDTNEVYNFNPRRVFVTYPNVNLTVVGVEPVDTQHSSRTAVDIVQRFTMDEDDTVQHPHVTHVMSKVKMVEQQRFYFRSGAQLLAGTPVFDADWRFQGITITSSSTYHYNEAIRVDAVCSSFLSSGMVFRNSPEMMELLSKIYYRPKQEPSSTEPSELCWFEWLEQRVIRYRIDLDRWLTVDIGNADELEIEGHGEWYFLWGAKSAILPDGTYLIVGGSRNQVPADDVYHYSLSENKVKQCQKLNMGRMGCALTYCGSGVYALGGEYTNGSCELYNLSTLTWNYISPMHTARYAMNAVSMNNMVYVVGGMPLSSVGESLERYSPQRDGWEILPVSLPEPVCNSGLCQVADDTIAIMGGRLSKRVLILQVSGSPSSFLLQDSTSLTFHECLGFSVNTETQYPTFLSHRTNTVYLFNSHESEHRPVLVKYKQECFSKRPLKSRIPTLRKVDASPAAERPSLHAASFIY